MPSDLDNILTPKMLAFFKTVCFTILQALGCSSLRAFLHVHLLKRHAVFCSLDDWSAISLPHVRSLDVVGLPLPGEGEAVHPERIENFLANCDMAYPGCLPRLKPFSAKPMEIRPFKPASTILTS